MTICHHILILVLFNSTPHSKLEDWSTCEYTIEFASSYVAPPMFTSDNHMYPDYRYPLAARSVIPGDFNSKGFRDMSTLCNLYIIYI